MSTVIPEDTVRHLRWERDRHVGFAFAAADLLIEVGRDGMITAAAGAVHAVLDIEPGALVNRPVADIVAPADRALVRHLLKQIGVRFRIDPAVVNIARPDGTSSRVLLGGCRLPDRGESLFLALTLVPDALLAPPQARDAATGLLTQDALGAAAQRLAGRLGGGGPQLQLVRLDGLSGAARQLPAGKAGMLMQEIGAALRAASVGGEAAGRLGEDAFGLVARAGDHAPGEAILAVELAQAIRGAGIPDGQVRQRVARIDLSLGRLTGSEAGRALSYAMNRFVRSQGANLDVAALQAGLNSAVDQAVSRFADTRKMLVEERFTLVYQPVVDLGTRAIHHYEALSRFPDGASTFETVAFTEDIGLILELDLIVCRRAIEAILRSANASVAANVSGRSVQNDAFRKALLELTARLGDLRHRLLFELTESAIIDDMTDAERFLARLRSQGHAVCLDDFGAGATAYNYLRRFDVDFVKIDGPFLRAAGERGRERALIRSVCVLCDEIGCKVIGEMIESETAAEFAKSLGIAHGQGWLFGKPVEQLPAPPRAMRRKGYVETWQ
jgi:EAL domain-containing protein (putative c-di-GMP-specific phosphodiesterase class I)